MLESLVLYNFPSGHNVNTDGSGAFCLKTCQRSMILSTYKHESFKALSNNREEYYGKDAYLYLLETICGLKSKLIGENEIVGQFKVAFKDFLQSQSRQNELIRILEKLFKDAKELRTQYLLGLSQKTYASLTRKFLFSESKPDKVLILGSGALAEDLINQFKKKAVVFIMARNEKRVKQLVDEHDIWGLDWLNLSQINKFSHIANTIGTEQVLFDEEFFRSWKITHECTKWVDLGSPCCIQTSYEAQDNVLRLDDIFKEGAVAEDHKKKQVEKAREAMGLLTEKRYELFKSRNKSSTFNNQKTTIGSQFESAN